MKQRLFQFFILLFIYFVGFGALADGLNAVNNPVINPCIQRPHLAGCGANGGQPSVKVINIPSHYGAVAYDADKGIVGASENNLKSIRSAKKEAVKRCIGYGGSEASCKVVAFTRNGCNALALGGKGNGGMAFGSARPTSQEAEEAVMQRCHNSGGEKCFIAYSHCSRDPRYQVGR